MSESIAAVNADVVWRTNTREATVDIEKLRREFHESTAQMSTDSLKLASAQDRLDRALVKHGASSKQARDAEIALRRATSESTVAAERHAGALGHEERNLGRATRGAVVGTGAFRGLARTVAFASTSFLGSFGLVYAVKSSIDAFREHETVVARVRNALARAGLDYTAFRGHIEEVIQAQSRLSAFDDEKLLDTFGRLVVRTKDVNEALKLNALAADIARARNIDLEAATQIVIKASIGQAGQLRRLGLDVDKHATATQLLAALQERYAGAAERYGKTSAGAADLARKSFQDLEEIVGRSLAPTLDDLFRRFATWAGDSRNQARIQRDVNEVVRTGGQVAHGLAEGLHAVETVAEPVVDALGGVENTAKLMIEAFAVYKLAKIAGAIRALGIQARFSRREITLLNATPISTTVPGTVVTGGAGRTGAGGATRTLPIGGATAVAFTLLSIAGSESAGSSVGTREQRYPLTYDLIQRAAAGQALSATEKRALRALGRYSFANAPEDALRRAEAILKPLAPGQSPIGENALGNRPPASTPAGGGKTGPGRKHGFDLPYNLQVEAARAAAGQGSELTAAQDALRYVKAQLAAGRLNKQGVLDALAEEAQLEDQIDAILAKRDATRETRRKKREAAEKKRREAVLKHDKEYGQQLLHDATFLTAQRKARQKQLAKTAKAGAASGTDFFGQAADEFRTYGSNVGDVLSGQDTRGLLAGIALSLKKIEGHSKSTAKATTRIDNGANPAKTAAALADVGAWTH